MITRRETLKLFSLVGASAAVSGFNPYAYAGSKQKKHQFTAEKNGFALNGQPFQVLAGEMHYPRIPRALWRDRMRKLKSMGLNTLSTYVFWNAHEPRRGEYDFSGNLDVAAFVRIAQEEGLWVCFRPGPFVCAEWDNGGFPPWLFANPDVKARSNDPRYIKPVKQWFLRLGQEMSPLLLSSGGPIIMTQIENEYGSYGNDHSYMKAIHQALLDAGFDGLFYTADGAAVMEGGVLKGIPASMNFGTYDKAEGEFAKYRKQRPTGPMMCGELWDGWFDHFGETHATMPVEPLLESLQWMMENGCSMSFYMFHGGTSFGFMAGANYQPDSHYAPDISSYDYDAVLDEAGRPTAKYQAVKSLFERYLPAEQFPPLPKAEKSIHIPRFRLTEQASLTQLIDIQKRTRGNTHFVQPQTLEALKQNYGLVQYSHTLTQDVSGELNASDIRDYALVFLDDELVGTLDRRFSETTLPVTAKAGQKIDILVEAMGRVNYGDWVGRDQKGLFGPVGIKQENGKTIALNGWDHIGLPLNDIDTLAFSSAPIEGPAFYRGEFDVDERGFTFFDIRGWGKGYVWVNGHNLGRYWSVGPQRAMYVPASWLKPGKNEIVVLDLHEGGDRSLTASEKQIWDAPRTSPV